MTIEKPEPNLPDYAALSARSVREVAKAAQAAIESRAAAIVAAPGPRSFENTLAPFDEIWDLATEAAGESSFWARLHPDPPVRRAAAQAEQQLDGMRGYLFSQRGLLGAVRTYADTPEAAGLEGPRRLLLDRLLAEFVRSGADLDPAARKQLEKMAQRLGSLSGRFLDNLAQIDNGRDLGPDELVGLPDEFITRLPPGRKKGSRHLSGDEATILAFLAASPRRDLRQEMEGRLIDAARRENTPILLEALTLRRSMARLLGYASWAEYGLVPKMAGSLPEVQALLTRLSEPLRALSRGEIERAADLLAADTGGRDLRSSDWLYYAARLGSDLDSSPAGEGFTLPVVFEELLDLSGQVFGLTFHQVPHPSVWHPDVSLYEIRDRVDDRLLAFFYADLWAREGKWEQPFAAALRLGHFGAKEQVLRPPVSALVTSFAPATPGSAPAALSRRDVSSLFHEFGHALHLSLMNSGLYRFNVLDAEWEGEFIEVPSQVLERWSQEPAILARIGARVGQAKGEGGQDFEAEPPARPFGLATATLRSIYFARLDLELHGPDEVKDLEALDRRAAEVEILPRHEGTCRPTSFGHIFGGYDVGYYGYLYSKVFGDDIYSRFVQSGLTDPAVGAAYRREILEPGWSRPVRESLAAFLGRPSDDRAFLSGLGLSESSD